MTQLLENVLRANVYIQPILLFLVLTVNIVNIRVLSSRTLRSSPCTHYLVAYGVLSIVYACIVCPAQFLRGFHIDWTAGKVGCKLHYYLIFLTPVQANFMLIIASFDRCLLSSQPRQLCSIRMARMIIVIAVLLTALYMLPMFIIYSWDEVSHTCLQQKSTLANVNVFSQMVLFYVFSPLLMVVLIRLTIWNIHRQFTQAVPLTDSIRNRRMEGQLSRMILLQVGVHLVFGLPFGIIYGINAFVPATQTSDVLAVRYMFVMWHECDYFISFFLYVIFGTVYREQFVRILRSWRCRQAPPLEASA